MLDPATSLIQCRPKKLIILEHKSSSMDRILLQLNLMDNIKYYSFHIHVNIAITSVLCLLAYARQSLIFR